MKFTKFGAKLLCFFLLVSLMPLGIAGTIVYKYIHGKTKEEVSVIDQGQGIPKNDIHKLFKMFGKANVRPTAGEKSTGLGLAICKHIVESHGGRIWVESEGTGATFKFTLPFECKTEELKG